MNIQEIEKLLGEEGQALLKHECKTISKDLLHLPGPDIVDRVWVGSDRHAAVLRSLQSLFNTGRLAWTGYVASRPGHRAFGRRELREKSDLLRF